MCFATGADLSIKRKDSEKIEYYLHPARELKKNVEYKGGDDSD